MHESIYPCQTTLTTVLADWSHAENRSGKKQKDVRRRERKTAKEQTSKNQKQ